MTAVPAKKKVDPVLPPDFELDPNEIYYVVESYYDREEHGWKSREVLESKDIYLCLQKSRELGPGTKVHRRRDGAVLALRSKEQLASGYE
jgi:hypothetical protein